MKGLKKITILVIGLFCLTGCGEKTLTCTNTEEDSGIKMEQAITMTFKDDKISRVKMSIDTVALDDDIKENWTSITETLESQYEESEEDGVKFTITNDANNYRFNMTVDIDINKASDEALAEYNLDNIDTETATYDSVLADAEADGFVCK